MPPSRSTGKKPATKAPSSRAKSGCYTCRIRRKKCDEKRDERGNCESCVRLKIQCLGFGAKRPDWLRESNRVNDLRLKIKAHLASQGMIKGHSGSGPRNVDNEHSILKLTYDDSSSATDSPTTPSLSLSSSDEQKPSPSQSGWVILSQYSDSGLVPSHNVDLIEGPFPSSQHYSESMVSSYPDIPPTITSATPWNNIVRRTPQSYSTYSSFSPTYHRHFDDFSPYDVDPISTQSAIFYTPPDPLLVHYATHVIPIEYLLADKRTMNALIQAMGVYGTAGEAARLLSIVHQYRSSSTSHNRRALEFPDVATRYNSLKSIFLKKSFEADDAFAALQVISAFLFDGGTGSWQDWLKIACSYCGSVLRGSPHVSVARALHSVNETTRFIIQTSMWFDVLASVTLGEQPHFLPEFRELYDPTRAHIDDPELSMMTIMGCENLTVWALSEISTLAKWKADELAKGRLSVPMLVEKAQFIEHHLDAAPIPLNEGLEDVDACRVLASRIFRASAKVYLHSVVSGSRPLVPEISRAVTETIDIINQVPETGPSGVSRSVMRSTVFGLFICGALTDDPTQQETIYTRLVSQHASETIGNTSSVTSLLQDLWANRHRRNRPDEEVYWREALKESQILLV